MEVYARVRRAVQVDGMSIREAARQFGLSRVRLQAVGQQLLRLAIVPAARQCIRASQLQWHIGGCVLRRCDVHRQGEIPVASDIRRFGHAQLGIVGQYR